MPIIPSALFLPAVTVIVIMPIPLEWPATIVPTLVVLMAIVILNAIVPVALRLMIALV